MEYLQRKWAPYDSWSRRIAFRCDFCNHIEGVNGVYLYWRDESIKLDVPSYLICITCKEEYDKNNSN